MTKKLFTGIGVLVLLLVIYLLTWPVPIDPVSWKAPPNPGYTGAFEANSRLAGFEKLPLGGLHGPEDIAINDRGWIYAPTHEGVIVRLKSEDASPEKWADTGGRPLGMAFDAHGNLIVADGDRGLLSVDPQGRVKTLATEANGQAIRYADDVDVAADGKIYFSDASTKFAPQDFGGTLEASLVDIMEHGGHGRLLVYDPETAETQTLIDGLNFANGVAVSPDQRFVLVNETGSYRVVRYWLEGPEKGAFEPIIEALPAFPDNISPGQAGRFWVALVSPRNPLLDKLSDNPLIRKMIQRIPQGLRPKAEAYGHIIAINKSGDVTQNLQHPDPAVPLNTGITETDEYLYIGSLATDFIPRLKKSEAGI